MIIIEVDITNDNINEFIKSLNLCWDNQIELYNYEKLVYTPNFNLGEFDNILEKYGLEIKVGENQLYVDMINNKAMNLRQYQGDLL